MEKRGNTSHSTRKLVGTSNRKILFNNYSSANTSLYITPSQRRTFYFKDVQPSHSNPVVQRMIQSIIGPGVSYPYQRGLLEILIMLMEVGELPFIMDVFQILYKGALMYRNFSEASYWVSQAKVIASFSVNLLKTTNVHIWASEVQKERMDYDQALWNLQVALSCAYKNNQKDKEIEIYDKIAKIYYYMGALDQAKLFHNRAMLFNREEQDGTLRTASLKSHFFEQVLHPRVNKFSCQILNQLWLPLNAEFLEYYQNRKQREHRPLVDRLSELRQNIRLFYDYKNGILLVQNLKSTNPVTPIQLTTHGERMNHRILISHKTRNKNVELFNTDQSIVPKISLMVKSLQAKIRKKLTKSNY